MKLVLLGVLVVLFTSSCSFLASRAVRVDPRTNFPSAQPFEGRAETLPGETPVAASDLRGTWFFREALRNVQTDIAGRQPYLYYALWIWLRDDGTYDSVYQAYWGTRMSNSPQADGVDVRESGQFSISGGMISLEPATTLGITLRGGNRERRTLGNEPRSYHARLDGAYLNLAGRCATYQVEPICDESREVWVSLRSVAAESPDDVPEL